MVITFFGHSTITNVKEIKKQLAKTIKEKMLFVDHRDRHSLFYTSKSIYNKLQSALNNEDINISFVGSNWGGEGCKFINDFIYK